METDTVASAKGDEESIDTRIPTAPELHQESFADVVGKKPVALLFATPQLCQSRVCGPVTDIALQMKAKYGDKMTFIHQEVYEDNDPNKGLRKPLQQFNLQSEPWLFVVGADGKVTSRLEGSFGLQAFDDAIKTALWPPDETLHPCAADRRDRSGRSLRGVRARPGPALEPADPGVAVRLGGGDRARDLVRRAGGAVAEAAAGGQPDVEAGARRRGARLQARRDPLRRDRGRPAGRRADGRLHRLAASRWTTSRRRSS